MTDENTILTYDDLRGIQEGEVAEPLVDVRTYNSAIVAEYEKQDMRAYTGDTIYVRDSVARKLGTIQQELEAASLRLRVVYGYRHPAVQQKYFDTRRSELAIENLGLSDEELDSLTHNFVAVPSVAGHPTGGAVDLTLIDSTGTPIDMGTAIADYSDPEKMKTFAPTTTAIQMTNRKILLDAMLKESFAPFYGEWWHFSYGDREWATFYDKKESLYSPILFQN